MTAYGSGAADVLAALRGRGLTLATAESLTGGLVGAALTAVAGSSDVYRGGIVCYATDLKASLVGVPAAVLEAHGPVAPETAAALAVGAARTCGADVGIATTGVAGPSSQDGHPVGEVHVSVSVGAGEPFVRSLHLTGDRDEVRGQSVDAVLGLLRETLDTIAIPLP
ncbi:MAG TPA: nicotinamide-nucleotide amidohydrolase family protein [Friedmanniella sp.]